MREIHAPLDPVEPDGREGATGAPWEGGFPRYVWYKHGETVFEGRLVNRETGEYKGIRSIGMNGLVV